MILYDATPEIEPTMALWVSRDKKRQLWHLLALANHGVTYCGQAEQPWPYALPGGVRPKEPAAMCSACIRAIAGQASARASAPLTWGPDAPDYGVGRDALPWMERRRTDYSAPGPAPLRIVNTDPVPLWRRIIQRITEVRRW